MRSEVFHICGSFTSASNLDIVLGTVCMGKQICVKIIVFAWKSVGQVEDNVSLITGLLCLISEFPQKSSSPWHFLDLICETELESYLHEADVDLK